MKKYLRVIASASIAMTSIYTVRMQKQIYFEDFSTKEFSFQAIDENNCASSKLFTFDSGLTFEYPDAVRGVYVTGHSAGGERFNNLVEFNGYYRFKCNGY